LLTNVTPLGTVPVAVKDGLGAPVAVTVKLPDVPTVNVVLAALVIPGACAVFTARAKAWLAGVPTPLLAVKVREYVPSVPDAGVPPSAAVPFPLSTNVTPVGSAPVSVRDGVGIPVAVTVKLPAVPVASDALLALVIAAPTPTSSPNTLNCPSVPTYTLPLATVGTENLTAPPGLSREPF
jgi:hypothetical protein